MKSNTFYIEDKDAKTKGRIAAILTLLLLLLGLFLISFKISEKEKKDASEEGLLVNFGTSAKGKGEIQPQNNSPVATPITKVSPNKEVVSPSKPKPRTSPPKETVKKATPKKATQKKVLTQKTPTKKIDSSTKKDVKKGKEEKKADQKKTIPKAKSSDNVSKTDAPTNSDGKSNTSEQSNQTSNQPAQPTVNKRALYPGKKNVPSGGEGSTNTNGDQGQPDGSPEKGAYKGKNAGLGKSGVGYSLRGRRLLLSPSVKDNSNLQGKITIKIKVDQAGNVISTSLGAPTTISNNALIKKCKVAAKQAKFDANRKAAEEQFGTMTFIFKVR